MSELEPPLTTEEREEIYELFEDMRVTDVSDGLDYTGHGYNLNRMSKDIRPLYRDMESFSHQVVGFAHTVRFLPTNTPRNLPDDLDDLDGVFEWRDDWYGSRSGGPEDIKEHDVIVVEAHEIDTGIIGSMNGFHWYVEGANGIVTNGGPRDTDELIKQDVPVYSKDVNKPIIPGRCELDDTQIPVNVGGCLVRPDDLIVADGDGVNVVPIEIAKKVAKAARREREEDQEARRQLYEKAGLEPDFTLE